MPAIVLLPSAGPLSPRMEEEEEMEDADLDEPPPSAVPVGGAVPDVRRSVGPAVGDGDGDDEEEAEEEEEEE